MTSPGGSLEGVLSGPEGAEPVTWLSRGLGDAVLARITSATCPGQRPRGLDVVSGVAMAIPGRSSTILPLAGPFTCEGGERCSALGWRLVLGHTSGGVSAGFAACPRVTSGRGDGCRGDVTSDVTSDVT